MKKLITAATALALLIVLVLAGSAGAWLTPSSASAATAKPRASYYVDELALSNAVEAHYQLPNGAHVQTAFCSGQRWRGVRTSEFGLDRYTYFSCSLSATDDHMYTARMHTVVYAPGSRYYSWIILSLKTMF